MGPMDVDRHADTSAWLDGTMSMHLTWQDCPDPITAVTPLDHEVPRTSMS
jgi:hypothetical protein